MEEEHKKILKSCVYYDENKVSESKAFGDYQIKIGFNLPPMDLGKLKNRFKDFQLEYHNGNILLTKIGGE